MPAKNQPPSVLITAFEAYGRWRSNASWLALVELTQDLPASVNLTTRRYPVDYEQVKEQLAEDLAADYDFAIHLGQAPGSSSIALEAFALNVRTSVNGEKRFCDLSLQAPAAYQSDLPLLSICKSLLAEGIPAAVSHHAGTYLCNATLFWSQHLAVIMSLKTRSTFIHLPLDISQVVEEDSPPPSLSAATSARAIRKLLMQLSDLD